MITENSVYQIGQITRTHGVKGEVVLLFTDDVWDRAEADFLVLRIDGILVPFFLEEYRFRSETTALVKFIGYDSAEAAKELCGTGVYFPHELTPDPEPDEEYTWRRLTGYSVEDCNCGCLGCISNVDDSTPNVLLHVGSTLIPAVEAFVLEVDHKQRIVHVSLPPELLHLND